jgi:glycine/D-amino acid oxidase-like deaminating enzyme
VDPSSPSSIEASCYWLATRPPRRIERLRGTRAADVVIVGGGFTGLWSALFLKELDPALSVAILEQGVVGYGGSGRNAGIVGETIDHSHELAARHFGFDEAKELARVGRENLDELEHFLSARGIDAEFDRTGQLIVALTEEQAATLRESVAFAHRLGLSDWRFLEETEARAELSSPLYRGAALAPRSGTIHPVRLVDGLAAEAGRLGVSIFEKTPVSRLSVAGGRVVASTPDGAVSAEKLVLATNAYTHALRPRLLSRYLPLYDYVVVSDPLTPDERRSIGWARRQGVTDARAFFNYYRLTSDGRVLFGTSEAVYHRGNRVDSRFDQSPAHSEALRASFERHFPQLRGLQVPLRLGRPHLLDDEADPVLRLGPRRSHLVRSRLHGARNRQHAAGRADPRAPGPRARQSASGARDGPAPTDSLPARAPPQPGRVRGDAEPAPSRRVGTGRPSPARSRPPRHRVFVLARLFSAAGEVGLTHRQRFSCRPRRRGFQGTSAR